MSKMQELHALSALANMIFYSGCFAAMVGVLIKIIHPQEQSHLHNTLDANR